MENLQTATADEAVVAHAPYRHRTDRRIAADGALNAAILDALPCPVFLLDRKGRAAHLNATARRSAAGGDGLPIAEGVEYLPLLARALGDGPGTQEIVDSIRAVIDCRRPSFESVRPVSLASGAPRWLMRAVPLGEWPGTVVVHTDVMALVRARTALEASLREADEVKSRLEAANMALQREVRHAHGFETIVGRSAALGCVLARVEQVAPTDSLVLLLGETGTGKDVLARAIHDRSRRRDRPMVAVNCAALPPTLIESELFGYERGAFTGALQRSPGRFEAADKGTIFLDEIGELPLDMQAKLLHVVQTGEFQRLGSPRTMRADVRIIAATNRNLEHEKREGRFRADLYYRLSVFPVSLPPLRDRPEDIPLLVWHFIAAKQTRLGKAIRHVPERLMTAFSTYPWPGNVRELENVIERAIILSEGSTLSADPLLATANAAEAVGQVRGTLEDVERAHIRSVLAECGWKVAGRGNAADRLGLNRSTLQFRMKKLGIDRPGPAAG